MCFVLFNFSLRFFYYDEFRNVERFIPKRFNSRGGVDICFCNNNFPVTIFLSAEIVKTESALIVAFLFINCIFIHYELNCCNKQIKTGIKPLIF